MKVPPSRVIAIHCGQAHDLRQAAQTILDRKRDKYGPCSVVGVLAEGIDGLRAARPRSGDAIYLTGSLVGRQWSDGGRVLGPAEFARELWTHCEFGKAVKAHARRCEGRVASVPREQCFAVRLRFRVDSETISESPGRARARCFVNELVDHLGYLASKQAEADGYAIGWPYDYDDFRLSREAIVARWSVAIQASIRSDRSLHGSQGPREGRIGAAAMNICKASGDSFVQVDVLKDLIPHARHPR